MPASTTLRHATPIDLSAPQLTPSAVTRFLFAIPVFGFVLRRLFDEHSNAPLYFSLGLLAFAVGGAVIGGLPFLLGLALVLAPLNLILIVIMTAG